MYDSGHIYKILEDNSQIVPSYIGTSLTVTNNKNNYNWNVDDQEWHLYLAVYVWYISYWN